MSELTERSISTQEAMDSISLLQALLDFEVANARVIDLTQRLLEASAVIADLRTDLANLKIDYSRLASDHQRMQESQAFRLAQRVWTLRNAIGI